MYRGTLNPKCFQLLPKLSIATCMSCRKGDGRQGARRMAYAVQPTARVLASQAEAIVRTAKHGHKLLNGGQATKRRN